MFTSLGNFGDWKIVKHNALTHCPFHQDDDPSFSINLENGAWYCFGCGARGNAKQLEELLGFPVWDDVRRDVKDVVREVYSIQSIYDYPFALDHPYLRARGVTNGQVAKFEIRAGPDGIYFPLVTFEGQLVGFLKRRTSRWGPRYVFHGRRTCSWPNEGRNVFSAIQAAEGDHSYTEVQRLWRKLALIVKSGGELPPRKAINDIAELMDTMQKRYGFPIIVTEGIFGALRADAAGLLSVAAMGASTAYKLWDKVKGLNLWDVIYAFDNDYAGWTGLMKALDRLSVMDKHRVLLPRSVEVDQMTPTDWAEVMHSDVKETCIIDYIWNLQEYASAQSGDPEKAMEDLSLWRSKMKRKDENANSI